MNQLLEPRACWAAAHSILNFLRIHVCSDVSRSLMSLLPLLSGYRPRAILVGNDDRTNTVLTQRLLNLSILLSCMLQSLELMLKAL